MIHGPKNPPTKWQPSIRSKSARIKTKAETEHSVNHSQIYLELKAEILSVGFWDILGQEG
jgi:hypothetical protein